MQVGDRSFLGECHLYNTDSHRFELALPVPLGAGRAHHAAARFRQGIFFVGGKGDGHNYFEAPALTAGSSSNGATGSCVFLRPGDLSSAERWVWEDVTCPPHVPRRGHTFTQLAESTQCLLYGGERMGHAMEVRCMTRVAYPLQVF